ANECFLLNVRANQMGAFPENPGHFYEWLQQNQIAAAPTDFVSRKIYGDYLNQILKDEIKNSKNAQVEIIKDEVIDIDCHDKKIILEKNPPIIVGQIILACGFGSYTPVDWTDFGTSTGPLTIIGTGLSMVDTVVYLDKINYQGKITAVSRHGRIPTSHQLYSAETPKPTFNFEHNRSLSHVVKVVKEHLKKYEWRLVIDALRPHNQILWKNWSMRERKQFLRFYRSLWDIHRHRMSAEHKKIIDRLIDQGKLEILAIGFGPYAPKTNRVISFTGFSLEKNSKNKLLFNLFQKNIIELDPLKLGIRSDNNGNVFEDWIYTLGPLRRGDLWECIAVPEIRNQAKELAELLLK
ncbi:MAG: FAD/NAD(P)-binding protein, partial [Bacteriovorax sp.]